MGGSTPDVPKITQYDPKKVQGQAGSYYNFGINKYEAGLPMKDPLLSKAYQGAQDFYGQLPGMLKQFPGFGKEIQGYQGQSRDLYSQLGGLSSRLGGIYNAPSGPGELIASGGAYRGSALGRKEQESLALQERMGTAHTAGGLANTILNTQAAEEARLAGAQQVGQQLTQGQVGINQAMGGNLGQQARFTGQRADFLGQEQALQSGGIGQLLGVLGAGTSAAVTTAFPWLQLFGNVLQGNQQASAQQAGLQAQASAAGAGGIGEMIGSIAQVIGPIIGAVAMSDKRLKTKIKDTGMRTEDDIPIKTFEYKTRPGVSLLGVIAQDVAKKRPDAVVTDPLSGVKSVNLWKLRAPMAEIKGG